MAAAGESGNWILVYLYEGVILGRFSFSVLARRTGWFSALGSFATWKLGTRISSFWGSSNRRQGLKGGGGCFRGLGVGLRRLTRREVGGRIGSLRNTLALIYLRANYPFPLYLSMNNSLHHPLHISQCQFETSRTASFRLYSRACQSSPGCSKDPKYSKGWSRRWVSSSHARTMYRWSQRRCTS